MSEIPVAVVGAGRLGSVHARVLHELPEAKLLCVIDEDEGRAREVAEKYEASFGTTIDDLPSEVAAAVCAVPTSQHHRVASALFDRGIHTMIEKPISRTVEEARDLVDRAASAKLTLMVGHSERFNPVMQALDSHRIAPRFIDSQRVSPFPFRGADVGVVLDMMIHDIDIILHLVKSPVVDVHAVGVPVVAETEDLANARLLFENGAVANATASRLAMKTERKIRVFSSDAYCSLDFQEKKGQFIRPGPGLEGQSFSDALAGVSNPFELMQKKLVDIEPLVVEDIEPLVVEDRAFLDAVKNGTEAPVSGAHGLLALETAERIVAALERSLGRLD